MRRFRNLWVLLLVIFLASCHTPKVKEHREDTLPGSFPIATQSLSKPDIAARIASAQAVAEARWNPQCRGDVVILRQQIRPVTTIAKATWWVGTDGVYFECKVIFNSLRARLAPQYYCAAMVHEYGHLAHWRSYTGHIHSSNPNSVMYKTLTTKNIPSICVQG